MAKGEKIIKTSSSPSIVKQAVFQGSGGPIKSFEPGFQFANSMESAKSKKKIRR